MIRRWLAKRREARERVQHDADELLTFLGDYAYREARHRARTCLVRSNIAGDRHWSRVASEIAKRMSN